MEGVKETEAQGKLSPEQEVVGSQEQGLLLSLPPGPPPPSSHHVVPSLWMLCELHPRTPCLQLLAGRGQRGGSRSLAGAPSAPPCLVVLVDSLPDPGPFSTWLLPEDQSKRAWDSSGEPGDRAKQRSQEDRGPSRTKKTWGDGADGKHQAERETPRLGFRNWGSGGGTVLKDGGVRVGEGMAM